MTKTIELLLICAVLSVGCSSHHNNNYNNSHCYPDAAKEFLRWNKVNGKELNGLTKRRKKEYDFFMRGCEDAQAPSFIQKNK